MNDMMIDDMTLSELQFDYLITGLKRCAVSSEGCRRLEGARFLTDPQEIEYQRDMISELLVSFSADDRRVSRFPEISSVLARLIRDGISLEGEEIWLFYDYISNSQRVKGQFSDEEIDIPRIRELLSGFPDLDELTERIGEYLITPGIIREEHPRIQKKMQQVKRARGSRSSLVQQYLSAGSDSMQSDQATIRENRIVLPIKSKDKQRYPGFVHSASQTGSTLFVEPYDLIERNNEVSLAEQELLIEIEKIFRELSDLIREHHEGIGLLQEAVGEFDYHYAKARFSLEHRYTRPATSERKVVLPGVRHPILQEKAIPITLTIDAGTRSIVMSGPNAGGKTVTLKTVGFIALMNQMGMFIPSEEGSELPVFSSIHTDIGDEQSIELDLSTFSGHLKRIGSILQRVDERSLVIFDELGSGTDPVEGAALAQAVIEYSHQRSGLTLITSHHASLKQFAYAQPGVMNASMEFSESEKSPTYRVILGEPGDSHAIETAVRMEFPQAIIERAREIVGKEVIEISAMMRSLKERDEQLRQREKQMNEREQRLKGEIRDSDLYRLKLRQDEMIQKRSDATSLQKYIKESRSLLETTIRELREEELTKERVERAREHIRELEQTADRVNDTIRREEGASPKEEESQKGFGLGERITVRSSGISGKILRAGRKREWQVELDNGMRLTLAEKAMKRELKKETPAAQVSWHTKVSYSLDKSGSSSSSIDVRGMTLAEAVDEIMRMIDAAIIHDLRELSIVHGKGEGILQRGIHDALSRMSNVKEFHFALPEDGGYGKTYVILL